METMRSETAQYCAYCGHPLAHDLVVPGELFCSGSHADEFAARVRAARVEAAIGREKTQGRTNVSGAAGCNLPAQGSRSWAEYLKRGACWGAPVLVLLAIPLLWRGGWAAAGGSFLSVVALLACPLGMYFMMRSMMAMQAQPGAKESDRDKEDR
jgi:hypothetical protein